MTVKGLQTWSAGEEVLASKMNTLSKEGVIDCLAASKPSLDEGGVIAVTDTDRLEVYDGSAYQRFAHWSSTGRTGGAWRRAVGVSVSSGTTGADITPDTEDADSDGFWSSGTTFTIPSGLGGMYVASLHTFWTADPGPATAVINWAGAFGRVLTTGSVGSSAPAVSGVYYLGVTGFRLLAASDTVVFHVQQQSGSSKTYQGYMDLYRIGI